MKLAKRHDIENKLYYDDGLNRIYRQLDGHRRRRWPSSVHGFSASYVALRNKAEIQLAIGLLRRYSPVVEYFTLESLLQEIIQQ